MAVLAPGFLISAVFRPLNLHHLIVYLNGVSRMLSLSLSIIKMFPNP
jgi:hypothetical protein